MPTDGGIPHLTVYGRGYCHLCDDLIEGLRTLKSKVEFEFDVVDVDSDPALEASYGELVPVVMHGEKRLCHYHLDVDTVTAYLRQIG